MIFEEFKRSFLQSDSDLYITAKPEIINFLAESNLKNNALACLIVKKDTTAFIGSEGDCELEMDPVIQKESYVDYSIENAINKLDQIKKKLAAHLKDGARVYADSTAEPAWLIQLMRKSSNLVETSDLFENDESIYSAQKQAVVKQNLLLNEMVYENLKREYRPLMTEYEVKQLILKTYFSQTGVQPEFTGDIVSGYRTCAVAGDATMKKLQQGDTLILDLLPRYNGVFCDTTRTFFIGEPTDRQKYIYSVLTYVLENTRRFIKPGVLAQEVYAEMMRLLKEDGLSQYMPHHAGHGLGFGMFQKPRFIRQDDTVLKGGMLIALEPGLYLPNEFGIRIEDNYIVTVDGCEKLGDTTLDMKYFILGDAAHGQG